MTVQNPSLPGSGIAVRVLRDDGKTYIGAVVAPELYTPGFAANAIRNSAGLSATEIARVNMIQTTKTYAPSRPPISEGPGWAVFHGSMVTAAIARDDGATYLSYSVDAGNFNPNSVASVLAAIPGLTATELLRARGVAGGVTTGATPTPTPTPTIRAMTTDLNAASPLMAVTPAAFAFNPTPTGKTIYVDTTQQDPKTWLGVGAHITDGVAQVLLTMPQAALTALLTKVFVTDGMNVLRIAFTDNDFTPAYTASGKPFKTYDDTDNASATTLPNFSIAQDQLRIIPILKQILALNPNVEFIASPWTPPAFMKNGGSLTGGSVINSAANFTWYATYFVKALQAYLAQGITINRVTVQNEPNNSQSDFPTCTWAATDMATFIGTYLGPALSNANLGYVKILGGDTSYDATGNRDYGPITTTASAPYVAGTAYHGYDGIGTASVMAGINTDYPAKELHMTENSFASGGTDPASKTRLASSRYARDIPRAGGQSIVWFALALAPGGQPGPSYNLSSPIIVNSDGTYTLWPEYYMLAHLGRYVQRGAKRCFSSEYQGGFSTNPDNNPNYGSNDVQSVAWVNPDGSTAVYLVNGTSTDQTVNVVDQAAGNKSTSVLVPTKGMASVGFQNPSALSVPLAPAVTLTPISGGVQVDLSNFPPANGGSAISGYTVRVNGTAVQTNGPLRYTITAPGGTAISVDVAAVNAQGTGAFSTAQNITPAVAAGSLPSIVPTHYVTAYTGAAPAVASPTTGHDILDGIADIKVLMNIAENTAGTYGLFRRGATSSGTFATSSFYFFYDKGFWNFRWWDGAQSKGAFVQAALPVNTWLVARCRVNVGTIPFNGLAPGTVEFSYSTDGVNWTVAALQTGNRSAGIPVLGTLGNIPLIGDPATSARPLLVGKATVARSDGTLAYSPDFTALTTGQTGTFTDSAGNVWSIGGAVA